MSEEKEDRKFEQEWSEARKGVDYFHMAHVLSGRLRQMEKRSRAANKRADNAADTIEAQSKLIEELREALQWMVDNDETNEGDEPLREHGGRSWNEMNAYWIDGINKARTALSKANPHSEKVE